jgi:DivIVA domain-containing protein
MANEQEASSTPTPSDPVITPADIQRQEFGVSRFGGYRMRDVDEFLDRLTASTEAVIAENERLRAGGSPIVGTSDLDEVNRQADEIVQRARAEAARIVAEAGEQGAAIAAGTAIATSTVADKAAVDAFLTRERDFLQSLAALVQTHAEAVKAMAKASRQAPPPPPPAADQPSPAADTAAEPVRAPETSSPEAAPPTGEEPVRVDEPQRAGTREGEGDPSLRQLFWGEEG